MMLHPTRPLAQEWRWLSRAVGWLVLPLALLLWAQWPLRDLLQAYSREANDLAQIVFAVYVAVAVTVATQAGSHLCSAGAPQDAGRPSSGSGGSSSSSWKTWNRWRTWAVLLCVGPWCVFMVWVTLPQIAASIQGLENFPETRNPGFFIIKIAMGILVILVLLDLLWQCATHAPTPLRASESNQPNDATN